MFRPTDVPTFVPRNEREHLLAVFAALAYERGYELTSLADVAQRARVDPAIVAGFWDDKEDCLLEALDVATQQAFVGIAGAFMSARADGPEAAHRALDALLRHLAGSPAFVHLAVIVLPTLGERAAARHKGILDLFAEFLGPGFAAMGITPPQPHIVAQVIAGGIFEVLRRHAATGRVHELHAALPAVSHVCIATFFGLEDAARVSGRA